MERGSIAHVDRVSIDRRDTALRSRPILRAAPSCCRQVVDRFGRAIR